MSMMGYLKKRGEGEKGLKGEKEKERYNRVNGRSEEWKRS